MNKNFIKIFSCILLLASQFPSFAGARKNDPFLQKELKFNSLAAQAGLHPVRIDLRPIDLPAGARGDTFAAFIVPVYPRAHVVPSLENAIAAGANVNLPGASGQTPLHIAVEKRDLPAVQFLLNNGASYSLGKLDKDGHTPLSWALGGYPRNRSIQEAEILEELFSWGSQHFAQKDNRLLLYAVSDNDTDLLRKLLFSRSIRNTINNQRKECPNTPLTLAVREINIEAVTLLLEAGIDSNAVDDWNKSALDYALEIYFKEDRTQDSSMNKELLVRILRSRGAKVTQASHALAIKFGALYDPEMLQEAVAVSLNKQ